MRIKNKVWNLSSVDKKKKGVDFNMDMNHPAKVKDNERRNLKL